MDVNPYSNPTTCRDSIDTSLTSAMKLTLPAVKLLYLQYTLLHKCSLTGISLYLKDDGGYTHPKHFNVYYKDDDDIEHKLTTFHFPQILPTQWYNITFTALETSFVKFTATEWYTPLLVFNEVVFLGVPAKINGGWEPWSKFSECMSYGDSQKRTRSCTNPAPKYGGAECVGSDFEFKFCLTSSVPFIYLQRLITNTSYIL